MGRETREERYWLKHHAAGRDIILAVCDAELLERTFTEGELSITVNRDFYAALLVEKKELREHMKRATILNLVGERCISIAGDMGWVERENTIKIAGVEHAQAAVLFDDSVGKD